MILSFVILIFKKLAFIDNIKGNDKMKKIPKRKKGLDWILF
jgi:hypothetical protein